MRLYYRILLLRSVPWLSVTAVQCRVRTARSDRAYPGRSNFNNAFLNRAALQFKAQQVSGLSGGDHFDLSLSVAELGCVGSGWEILGSQSKPALYVTGHCMYMK